MRHGETRKRQLAIELAVTRQLLMRVKSVPLVHRQHQRAALLEDVTGQTHVLVAHLAARIEHQNHDIRLVDRLQRLDD